MSVTEWNAPGSISGGISLPGVGEDSEGRTSEGKSLRGRGDEGQEEDKAPGAGSLQGDETKRKTGGHQLEYRTKMLPISPMTIASFLEASASAMDRRGAGTLLP